MRIVGIHCNQYCSKYRATASGVMSQNIRTTITGIKKNLLICSWVYYFTPHLSSGQCPDKRYRYDCMSETTNTWLILFEHLDSISPFLEVLFTLHCTMIPKSYLLRQAFIYDKVPSICCIASRLCNNCCSFSPAKLLVRGDLNIKMLPSLLNLLLFSKIR